MESRMQPLAVDGAQSMRFESGTGVEQIEIRT
jgi:hypothetical protein